MAVARPLPMVSPGVWPAPITSAILSARRPEDPMAPEDTASRATEAIKRREREDEEEAWL
jgi:hypothetical protein